MVDNNSFLNIKAKWISEIRKSCPQVPIILVGTKLDLYQKSPEDKLNVNSQMAEKLKREIKAAALVECSARTQLNLNEVFTEAVRCVLRPEPTQNGNGKKKQNCMVM
jgi:GTPase SAR1 family protein